MATVLVIEDDPVLGQLLREVLEFEGHTAVVAASLKEASRAMATEQINLVLADLIEFDLLGGPRAVQALTELAGGLPVLLCSGQPEAERLGRSAGVTAVLGKPFDFDALLSAVTAALTGTRPDR